MLEEASTLEQDLEFEGDSDGPGPGGVWGPWAPSGLPTSAELEWDPAGDIGDLEPLGRRTARMPGAPCELCGHRGPQSRGQSLEVRAGGVTSSPQAPMGPSVCLLSGSLPFEKALEPLALSFSVSLFWCLGVLLPGLSVASTFPHFLSLSSLTPPQAHHPPGSSDISNTLPSPNPQLTSSFTPVSPQISPLQRDLPQNIITPYPLTWVSLVVQLVKNSPAMQETPVRFLGQEDPLEKG